MHNRSRYETSYNMDCNRCVTGGVYRQWLQNDKHG